MLKFSFGGIVMGLIPNELMEWLAAVVKRLDLLLDAERATTVELKLLRIELRHDRDRLEGN